MKRGGGKAKGAAFEREVCETLSLWVSGGKHRDLFWRSAMSGGRASVAKRSSKGLVRQAGDITAVTPAGHALTDYYYIECKHVQRLAIDSFLLKGKGALYKFWRRCVKEARSHDRAPMLIARQNTFPTIIVMRGTDLADLFYEAAHDEGNAFEVLGRRRTATLVLFDQFLQHRWVP